MSDDFTPFGYLRNPGHHAASWAEVSGGNLRTADDSVGLEWVYPWHKHRAAGVGVSLTTSVEGRACRRRADFAALGYTSRHHSADVLGFDWSTHEVDITARFFLVDEHTLGLQVRLSSRAVEARPVSLGVFGRAWSADGELEVEHTPDGGMVFAPSGADPRVHALLLAGHDVTPSAVSVDEAERWLGWQLDLQVAAGETRQVVAALGRAGEAALAFQRARVGLAQADTVLAERLHGDAAFRAACPALDGDWPPDWRSGLVYDLETTRALVLPAGGIFHDVWPTWMAAWPRVVLAEGTLDMLRLALVEPETARQAVLSLFRDAPMPNVPCVFQDGGYNMLAADGRRCGTSPAWCLPFLNLELLYLRGPDRDWLGELYPYLSAYVEWWLDNRTDAAGWLVYACTWESGEDGNPRLDPSGSGDAVISGRVRPVELQATLAHAASVLAFFAHELGRSADEIGRWRRVQADFADRTLQLFDPAAGRFRDWLIAEHSFVPPCPGQPYWGVDACRWSPLALTPLLAGVATPEQVDALAVELDGLTTAPWTSWPSWCYVLVECAAAAGLYARAGEIAWRVIDHVYRVTTRRELAELARPTPGGSPEFWPQDWRTFQGCDAYGWGATTANLLVRHLVGFKEARPTDGWHAELTPGLAPPLMQPGRRYSLRNLEYRGLHFDLTYVVNDDHALVTELQLPRPLRCSVSGDGLAYTSDGAHAEHRFRVTIGQRYALRLDE